MGRSEGRKQLLLVDEHGSRFGLEYLKYITDKMHAWMVCIGAPCRTALWQVGDSSKQNDTYNIALANMKEKLIATKQVKRTS